MGAKAWPYPEHPIKSFLPLSCLALLPCWRLEIEHGKEKSDLDFQKPSSESEMTGKQSDFPGATFIICLWAAPRGE